MELSKLLEKISEKYPDDKDVLMAKDELANMDMPEEGMEEEMPEDDLSLGAILDMEPEGGEEEAGPELDMLLEEDMGEEEDEDLMPKKKSKKPLV